VCAVSLVGQWCAEAAAKLQGQALKMHQYHGQNRCKDASKLAMYDLVGIRGGCGYVMCLRGWGSNPSP